MNTKHRSVIARLTLAALVLALLPSPARSDDAGARIEGLLVDMDGKAATGYQVHLIDPSGRDIARAGTTDGGIYSFRDLPSGEYSLGIENPEGLMAPVAAPPVRLADNQLARRDIKLVPASAQDSAAVGVENASIGLWWAGLSPAVKAWTIIGSLAFLAVVWAAFDNEDDESPITTK